MKDVILTDTSLCVGCNRCSRTCPIATANVTYRDEGGDIKVRVDSDACIACGACISVCKHNARGFIDSTDDFFNALSAGESVTVIAAPSVKTNFPEYKRLITLLKRAGVKGVYDVSMGADICVWAHLKFMEREKPLSLVAQPCSAVVNYCTAHKPELLPRLSPVHSPMACLAVYLKKHMGITGKIAALSPCIAKIREFNDTGLIDYNVTFARLKEFLQKNGGALPAEEGEFDNPGAGLGGLFPLPGGLKENLQALSGGKIRADCAEGAGVYTALDVYAATPERDLPQLFDVLSCAGGCSVGSGCDKDQNIFSINRFYDGVRAAAQAAPTGKNGYPAAFSAYDKQLNPADFMREYKAAPAASVAVTEEDISEAFKLLDKNTYAQQNFNCGACGSDTCREMAKKIALNINIPSNCIVKSRDDLRREHAENIAQLRRTSDYIGMIQFIGESLFTGEGDFSETLKGALRALCQSLDGRSAQVWRQLEGKEGKFCRRIAAWPEEKILPAELYPGILPGWLEALSAGESINRMKRDMTEKEKAFFSVGGTDVILAVPIMIRNKFWGFMALDGNAAAPFGDEEISVLAAGGMLIVSCVIEREMTESLVAAKEEALSGARAKTDFLSRMSHEMRTPMNAIIGMAKIAEGTQDLAKLKHCISAISASGTHLLGLINDILDMSKIEAGKFELSNAPFNLEATLIKASRLLLDRAEQKNQRLSVFLQPGLSLLYIGDELRLSQVLTNLLSNAVKFTPEGGSITLTAENKGLRGFNSLLRFTVKDTGIGMSAEQLSRLFTAFEQASSGISKKFGGTGLGLAISKTIAEKMKGRISAQSEPGKGSEFIFEAELMNGWGSPYNGVPEGTRVLLLPASETARAQVTAAAEYLEMTADTPLDIAETRALLKSRPGYDAIIAESQGTAESITELLAAAGAEQARPVIALTTFLEWNKTGGRLISAGVTAPLYMPVFPATLAEAVNAATAEKAEGAEGAANGVADFSDITLLLAEDIEINREIFCALLEETRVNIEIAENGAIALEKFAAAPYKYNIIIMDIQMPEMDGYEATRQIRALPCDEALTVPIVAMTANAFKEDVEKCLAAGMNDHLMKPVDEKALIERIARYTGK